jgi:hypothetical protein
MLTMAIWCVGTSLEVVLLFRGLQTKLFRSFPIFYSYILFVFVEELLRFSAYRFYPDRYAQVYWVTQFLSLFIGSMVIFEIYRVGLRRFPGTARMARYLLMIVFGAVFAKELGTSSTDLFSWLARTSVDLEGNLRIVQGVAIATLLSLFLLYAIPFGRNLKGILAGYGLFVGMSILQFTLWHYSVGDLRSLWPYAQPLAYLVVLGLWGRALWSAHPAPLTEQPVELERDYQMLAASTRVQLERALSRLRWAARP